MYLAKQGMTAHSLSYLDVALHDGTATPLAKVVDSWRSKNELG